MLPGGRVSMTGSAPRKLPLGAVLEKETDTAHEELL